MKPDASKDLPERFADISQKLSSAATTESAARIIVDAADELIGWDACSLDFYFPERDTIWPVFAMDFIDGLRIYVPPVYSVTAPSRTASRVLTEGGQLILRAPDTELDAGLIRFGDKSRPSKSLIFVAIHENKTIVAILSIQSYQPYAYTQEDVDLLQLLGDHCGGALNRIRGQEAVARLAAIVETCTDAIISTNVHGMITSWNAAASRIFGYAASEAQGHELSILLPSAVSESEQVNLRNIEKGGEASTWEAWRTCKDGRMIEVAITASPLKNNRGQVIGISQIVHDITQRRRAERQVQALSRLGRDLGAATSPLEVARVIVTMTDELFGCDALTMSIYSAQDDLMQLVLSIDSINDRKIELQAGGQRHSPSVIARRVMGLGGELILKQPPIRMLPDEVPFGDTSRPSASIMRTVIQHRNEAVGLLSVHSYKTNAYTPADLATLRVFADYCADTLARINAEEKMAGLHGQLLNTARRAGMEEVANSVLQNIGSVLNHVCLSAGRLSDLLQSSKLDSLAQLGTGQNLNTKQFGTQITAIAEHWKNDKTNLLNEIAVLSKNLDQIKEVIHQQESLAGNSAFAETVFISDLLEEALEFSGADLATHGVKIIREYTMHFPVMLDKMKIMLILVNLITNARDALLASSNSARALRLRTELRGNERLHIVIDDNGIGIGSEQLDKVFQQGFTTKKNGHGFGLHSSRIAAQELGGHLTFKSRGLGHGAQFMVELPLNVAGKNRSSISTQQAQLRL